MTNTYPNKLPVRYRYHWDHPWTRKAKYSPGFRRWLARHHYLTPHFTMAEGRCKDGTDIPRRKRPKARNHAFKLERLRHGLGGHPVQITSWYRTKRWNNVVGGARNSKHIQAIATDHPAAYVDKIGRDNFLKIAGQIFKNDGVGVYPNGAVHLDSRGYKARWNSWVR